jgi:hypothetical protein
VRNLTISFLMVAAVICGDGARCRRTEMLKHCGLEGVDVEAFAEDARRALDVSLHPFVGARTAASGDGRSSSRMRAVKRRGPLTRMLTVRSSSNV